jgi:hypothetical protein
MEKKITSKSADQNGVIRFVVVDGVNKPKHEVIDAINKKGKGVYFTYVDDKKGSEVYAKNGYLTTKPNDATRDNLDELPETIHKMI